MLTVADLLNKLADKGPEARKLQLILIAANDTEVIIEECELGVISENNMFLFCVGEKATKHILDGAIDKWAEQRRSFKVEQEGYDKVEEDEPALFDYNYEHGGLTIKELSSGEDIFFQGDEAGDVYDSLEACTTNREMNYICAENFAILEEPNG
ncbi:MAG: hypothetical protein WC998_00740 [Candidatus Paceibacterota bacterium]|jgi:hypothetical protein